MAYVSQADKAKLAPQIKKVLNKYGMKGSISIRHHMSLVVTLQSGAIDFKDYSHGDGYIQVNVHLSYRNPVPRRTPKGFPRQSF